jgi:D-alanyl-lipoteichoic acid acyltransferase DltB (MBOAT superfamily)
MLFPTLTYALFFIAVFAGVWALGDRNRARKALLVAVSYFFYAQWDARFCLLLLASTLANYGFGLAVGAASERSKQRWVFAAVAVNLTVLGFFKYYNFFVESANDLFFRLGLVRELPFLEIVLPVGISFFTFHGISYIVDIYRGKIAPARDPLDILLYISFFPQLVAGPIVRASFFLPQLAKAPAPVLDQVPRALGLILVGLFKKTVVANYLATDLVDPVFVDPASAGTLDLWMALYGYAVQIYCDFSAYSDMAIGFALLLGYRFPDNFDRPYAATSLQDFWRRWHMSLSSWLRDYLYIPLGGSRGGTLRTYRNLALTMVLGGLWHGASWTFILWGSIHGVGLAIERALFGDRQAGRWGRLIGWFVTFHIVCLAWVLFRSANLEGALGFLGGLAGNGGELLYSTPFLVALIGLSLAAQFGPREWASDLVGRIGSLSWPVRGLLFGLALAAIDALGPEGVAPFIYFQF